MPRRWYNLAADLGPCPPPLDPSTGKPMGPEKLAVLFPMALLEQEMSTERWIPIPEEVLEVYRLWRPTPLVRALALEHDLETPAEIWYKYEGVSPAGSHKPNTAVAQAFYNKREGVERISTETGAGQWGSALAFACDRFGIKCKVYMVRCSFEQKPARRSMMQTWGAEVTPSPSRETEAGRKVLTQNPDSPGSLGIAISEAVEVALGDKKTHYSLGSVLNHVLLHQTIVGLEAKAQMERMGVRPDVVIGCHGGGSNAAGFIFPFLQDKIGGRLEGLRAILAEPWACPTISKGVYKYDFGDTLGLTPLVKMYTLGSSFVPPAIHAGGLRYHGSAPMISHAVSKGLIEVQAWHQNEVFEANVRFARTEGIIPAPESGHAVKSAIEEALKAKAEKRKRVIAFNLSGHGLLDLSAYDAYLAGELVDYEYPQQAIDAALAKLPQVAEG